MNWLIKMILPDIYINNIKFKKLFSIIFYIFLFLFGNVFLSIIIILEISLFIQIENYFMLPKYNNIKFLIIPKSNITIN